MKLYHLNNLIKAHLYIFRWIYIKTLLWLNNTIRTHYLAYFFQLFLIYHPIYWSESSVRIEVWNQVSTFNYF